MPAVKTTQQEQQRNDELRDKLSEAAATILKAALVLNDNINLRVEVESLQHEVRELRAILRGTDHKTPEERRAWYESLGFRRVDLSGEIGPVSLGDEMVPVRFAQAMGATGYDVHASADVRGAEPIPVGHVDAGTEPTDDEGKRALLYKLHNKQARLAEAMDRIVALASDNARLTELAAEYRRKLLDARGMPIDPATMAWKGSDAGSELTDIGLPYSAVDAALKRVEDGLRTTFGNVAEGVADASE